MAESAETSAMEVENAANEAATTTSDSEDKGVDLSPDKNGGILKKILREGTGDEGPGTGDTVFVHYVGTLLDGSKFDSSRDRNDQFSFKLGTGTVIKAWDIGVASMKKGELCVLTCKPEYAYGETGSPPKIPPNSTLLFEVELFRWEGEDLSESNDGGVTRKILKAGNGFKTPNDEATVEVHLKGIYNGNVFDERDVTFTLGDGDDLDICPGIELALKSFKHNEQSRLHIKSKYAFGAEGKERFNIPANVDVDYEVTLSNFEKGKEAWEMDSAEKLSQSDIVKQKGTDYFKAGKFDKAINYYKKILSYIENENLEGEEKSKRNSLLLAAHLNMAMCYLKLEDFVEAEKSCEKALEIDPKSEKGLFRRGMARLKRNEYEEAMADFKEVLHVDPNNKAARKEMNTAAQKLKAFRQTEKSMYSKMFSISPGSQNKPVSKMETSEGGDGNESKDKKDNSEQNTVVENGDGEKVQGF